MAKEPKNIKVIFFSSACILISMFNLITINLNYSCRFMYPVNVFKTSINKNCFKIPLDNKQYITHIKEITYIKCCNIKQAHRWVCVL